MASSHNIKETIITQTLCISATDACRILFVSGSAVARITRQSVMLGWLVRLLCIPTARTVYLRLLGIFVIWAFFSASMPCLACDGRLYRPPSPCLVGCPAFIGPMLTCLGGGTRLDCHVISLSLSNVFYVVLVLGKRLRCPRLFTCLLHSQMLEIVSST